MVLLRKPYITRLHQNEVTPKFAQVKGNFININDRFKSEKSILLSHLNDHVRSYKLLISKYLRIKNAKFSGYYFYTNTNV